MSSSSSIPQLVDHLFRYESGKMVAVLSRVFGIHNLELAEDVVQEAFLKAMQVWKFDKPPDNPAGWLMQTARNKAIDILRRQENFHQFSKELAVQLRDEAEQTVQQFFAAGEIADSQLRMIFACCHPSLKEEDQVALTLKVVSGFGVAEIARALLTHEAVIKKRLSRAKQFLCDSHIELEIPAGEALLSRLDTVYTILYLLFNEGYNSLKADELIREDLCMEAMRLCLLLSENDAGRQPPTYALLSLMCFQASRFDSRMDENNDIILLAQQDRNKWNKDLIQMGGYYLNRSSYGDRLSVYHIESVIAAEHCLAPSFKETNWKRMLSQYDLLLQKKRTPVVIMNRAIVLAQLQQADKAIGQMWSIEGIEQLLATQYIYCAVLGDLYLQYGDTENGCKWLNQARELTASVAEKNLIMDKLSKVQAFPDR